MTAHDGPDLTAPAFDRLMMAWFDAEASVSEPSDLLDRTLARTGRTHPRPAWLLPERWIPMELTMRRVRFPRAAAYVVLSIGLLVLAVVALIAVGSQRHVPTPFGLARNGVLLFATPDHHIATIDPATGTSRTIVGGPDKDGSPAVSLDGTRVAFVREVPGGSAIYSVGISGDGLRRLTKDPLVEPAAFAWSPDGSRLAFESDGRLWIARTDGSGAAPAALDLTVDAEIEWRPPDGAELLVRGVRDGSAGLFLVDANGQDPQAITPIDGGANDYLWVTWSPDGRRVAYHRHPALEVHVLTIGQPSATVLRPIAGLGMMFPRFSPDGSRLAVMVWDGTSGSPTRIGVLSSDDPTPAVTLTGPAFISGIQFDWSPDGERILAVGWDTDAPWILDPSGGGGEQASWSMAIPDWVEWQRTTD